LPSTAAPAGTAAGGDAGATGSANTGAISATPGQSIGVSSGIAPAELPQEPPAIAPGYEAPARPLPSAERVGVNLDEQTPLTLDDAIRLAIENNNDLDTARINVRLAEFDLTGARGAYDPIFSSESFYERSVTPVSSVIGGGANGSVTQTNATGAARFGGFSPFGGGSYQADFSSTRITTNNRFVSLNPQFPSALTLTYTQPLLRGRGFDQRRRLVEINKRNLSLTDAQFRQRAIDVVTQVESSYWDLAFALRNLQVQIDAVKQARIQVESNRRLVAAGVLAPIDLVAADAQVTTFEQNVYTAQESVTRNENALKTLLLASRANPLWSRPIVPVTPVNLEPPRVGLDEAVASAITNRPELAQIETSSEINRINQRFFREQTRPQVDLVGTYNPVGLAGTAVPRTSNPLNNNSDAALQERVNDLSRRAGLEPLPTLPDTTTNTVNENLVGGYAQSLGNLLGQNYPTLRVGVRVQIPFRNRTAQADFGRALAEGTQIENLKRQTEQLIEADVRNSLQSVRSAEARLASAASARSSAEQQDASERRQFAAGTSTLFLVFQRQTELLAARGRELQAQTDLNKSIALLERATGTTLTANNVALRLDTQRTTQRGQGEQKLPHCPLPIQRKSSRRFRSFRLSVKIRRR
jgi:HAE1 family hydrophobic/amphiphilic exporter-1